MCTARQLQGIILELCRYIYIIHKFAFFHFKCYGGICQCVIHIYTYTWCETCRLLIYYISCEAHNTEQEAVKRLRYFLSKVIFLPLPKFLSDIRQKQQKILHRQKQQHLTLNIVHIHHLISILQATLFQSIIKYYQLTIS